MRHIKKEQKTSILMFKLGQKKKEILNPYFLFFFLLESAEALHKPLSSFSF